MCWSRKAKATDLLDLCPVFGHLVLVCHDGRIASYNTPDSAQTPRSSVDQVSKVEEGRETRWRVMDITAAGPGRGLGVVDH